MSDPVSGARAAKELLARDPVLRKKIFAHAYSLTRHRADAEELAQEGIARAIDPDASPWDSDKQPNLLRHIGSLMNGIAANKRRSDRRHPTVADDFSRDTAVDLTSAAEDPLAYEKEMRRLEGWLDALRLRLEGDTLALATIELLSEGVDAPAVQATRLGCTAKDIYRANERIAYHADIVKRAAAGNARGEGEAG